MATSTETGEDTVSAKVLQQSSRTPYACSSLTQLSSRPVNFAYRDVLSQPFTTQNGMTAGSIIIKHSTDVLAARHDIQLDDQRSTFEEALFNSVAEFSCPSTIGTMIKAPRLYLPSPATAGRHLGSWLQSFHTWASAPAQATLRGQMQMLQDDPIGKVKYLLTYDSFFKVLENYPELLEAHQEKLETIRDVLGKEFEKSPKEDNENWGLIHGDFWSGNILVQNTPWVNTPQRDRTNKLFIIDWKFAQFGHRCYDLGKIVGDLIERRIYNDNSTGMAIMEGVIDGYGNLSDEMTFRTAIYVGVYVIGWYNRRPRKGPWVAHSEAIVAGLAL
ncbi:phosphotransferase enzyme family protein [Seiridium cupressi]